MHEQLGLSRHHVKQTIVGFDDYSVNMTDKSLDATVHKCMQNSSYTRGQGTITVLSI